MTNSYAPEFRISVSQLRPGVFIRLEGARWFDHPFLFNSFKVKDAEQIELIRQLGIREVICVPERCDVLPLKPGRGEPEAAREENGQTARTLDHLLNAKRERSRRLREKKERIARCEERFNACIQAFNAILSSVAGGTAQSVGQAVAFVDRLADYFLEDRESTLHLMHVVDRAETAYSHPMNVAVLSLMVGREAGLPPEAMNALGLAALFHDIGKAGLPRMLLHKRGDMTRSERETLEQHPRRGEAALLGVGGFPDAAARVVAQHHERMDGSGYPDGLTGEAIDPLARILAIADAYDNHTNQPDPGQSLTPYLALSYMFGQQKHLFDMELLALFIRCLGIYPPGTVVELSNGAVGMVMSVNPRNQLNPSVVVYDENVPRREALIVDLADEEDLRVEKSIRLAHLPPKVLEYLSPRTRIAYFVEPE
ncbi:HD-GYP domain-containing protein [Pseudodesulfovibrio sp.]|uniref:HD-GYP domain-containing protein n=1 Tax=Pseudodesulfovibrio sp. TaxID=2035812 RepID=UPI0026230A30|nr:HD-GYP domain-containing protein [Pseudodesulfovibrio sp.]MDD3313050.1 HD-GYP domain-containing protein [Pseudodesulfovibrio sp.]